MVRALITCDSTVVSSIPGRRTVGGVTNWQLQASCSHPSASVTKQYKLVQAKGRWRPTAGKVTVGLASHTLMVYSPTGSKAYDRKMSTSPILLRGMADLYLYLLPQKLWEPVPAVVAVVAPMTARQGGGGVIRSFVVERSWSLLVATSLGNTPRWNATAPRTASPTSCLTTGLESSFCR